MRAGSAGRPHPGEAGGADVSHELDAATEEARQLGVLGSPTFAAGTDLFWSDDNLEAAVQWARWGRLGASPLAVQIAGFYRTFRDFAGLAAAWRSQHTEVLTHMTQPENGNPEAAPPLILTLRLEAAAQTRFNAERAAHFPPARNYLSAHLTLFHHLPSAAADAIGSRLQAMCEQQPCFALEVHDLWMMGRGVAYRLRSPELARLHADLAEAWWDWLTPQDRQPLRPHVTIQNKVGAEQARALHDRLRSGFVPFEARGIGLLLWRYRGGPWEPAAAFPFSDA